MKALYFVILSFLWVSACSSTQQTVSSQKEWLLRPSSADKNLNVDEQFLKKAQKSNSDTVSFRSRRRPFLKP